MTTAVILAAAFEVVGFIDSLDFGREFDIETDAGNLQVLEYALSNGVTAVWWRDRGGGLTRYPSREESPYVTESPFTRCRLPSSVDVCGRLRLDRPDAVPFPPVFAECARRGVGFGIHTGLEENHWLNSFCSGWNLAHPQYWCRRRCGILWSGHASLAYPEVMRHKLAQVDERLAFRPQTIFLDLYRRGGWGPSCEYTAPVVARWHELYGDEEPPAADDSRWCKVVSEYVEAYLREFAAKCHRRGVAFGIGGYGFDGVEDGDFRRSYAVDWSKLARDGVIDYVVVMGVDFDKADIWGSTERIYRSTLARAGKAKVYFPLAAYTYQRCCLKTYAKVTRCSDAEAAARLAGLARKVGGAGVVLECLDYGNYSAEVMKAILSAAGKR